MPTYTNPQTIDLNTQKSAPELQSNFDALQAALNGGLDETNVPNLAAAFTTYKGSLARGGVSPGALGAGTYIGPAFGIGSVVAVGTATVPNALWIDPADWTANARTSKLRLRVAYATNAVAPAVTFTWGFYPVASIGGASGATPTIATLGAVVTGSTVTVTTPAATTLSAVTGSDFNAPAVGLYAIAVAISGTMTAGAIVSFVYDLQYRQV